MKTTLSLLGAAIGALLLTAAPSQAATVTFTDNFDSDTFGAGPGGWTSTNTRVVDTIGTFAQQSVDGASTNQFMSLRGGTSPGAVSRIIDLSTNGLATLSFDFAGWHTEIADTLVSLLTSVDGGLTFSSTTLALSLIPGLTGDPGIDWQHYSTGFFSVAPGGLIKLAFSTTSNTNTEFAFVDNINLTAVPLPAALPLGAAGLGALGLLGWFEKRRRGQAVAA